MTFEKRNPKHESYIILKDTSFVGVRIKFKI